MRAGTDLVRTIELEPGTPTHRQRLVWAVTAAVALLVAVVVGVLVTGTGPTTTQRAARAVQSGLEAQQDGDLAAASTQYHRAAALDPTNVYAQFNLGVLAASRDDADAAATAYEKALRIDDAYEPALYNYAVLLQQHGHTRAALRLYQRAVQADPNDPLAHFNLGLMLRGMPKYDKDGTAQMRIAVKLDPSLSARASASSGSRTR